MADEPHNTVVRVKHPLLEHKITYMRMPYEQCPSRLYVQLMREAGMIIASEVTRRIELTPRTIKYVPREPYDQGYLRLTEGTHNVLKGKKPVIIPILRSGLIMAEGVQQIIPTTHTGHLGIHHAPNQPVQDYLVALPKDILSENPEEDRKIVVVDPVISSGDTAIRAIEILKSCGVDEENIYFLTLIIGTEGEARIRKICPNISVFAAITNERVENRNLVPGIGKVSNRLYRTT